MSLSERDWQQRTCCFGSHHSTEKLDPAQRTSLLLFDRGILQEKNAISSPMQTKHSSRGTRARGTRGRGTRGRGTRVKNNQKK